VVHLLLFYPCFHGKEGVWGFLFCWHRTHFLIFFCGTRIWNQGFSLAKQVLYYLSHTSSPFCSSYFGNGGVSWTICPGWPRTVTLLISASQVAKIVGMSLCHPHKNKKILNLLSLGQTFFLIYQFWNSDREGRGGNHKEDVGTMVNYWKRHEEGW
jgi:hypothetical protein